jgi:hypothetical protein
MNNKSHHKCTKITCVFEQTNFISTPPSTSKNPNVQTQIKSLVHDYCKIDTPFTNPSSL